MCVFDVSCLYMASLQAKILKKQILEAAQALDVPEMHRLLVLWYALPNKDRGECLPYTLRMLEEEEEEEEELNSFWGEL